MGTLSSSIVRQQIASMRDVEEALARQVLYGGDLATNLLELAAVREAQLTQLLAESHGLEPAPAGELPQAPDATRRLVPGELAMRHGLYPLEEREGSLMVAVSEPLPAEVEQDLSFSLGAGIVQRVAPLVRIRQAISRDYGLPMDRRTLRLVAKLEGRADPSPSSLPPPGMLGATRFASVPPAPALPQAAPPTQATPPPFELEPAEAHAQGSPSIAKQPATATVPAPAPAPTLAPAAPAAVNRALSAPPFKATQPSMQSPLFAQRPSSAEAQRRLAELTRPEVASAHRRRHLGPYTAAMAERDLTSSESRDDVMHAFFDFASQYFEYAALFAVHGDLAEGRDAHGPGTDAAHVSGIGVPLDLPSALSEAKKGTALFQLVRLAGDGLDAALAKDLGRKTGHIVLLLPVRVRGRCVLVLYGDHGDANVELETVGDIIAFAPLVAAALESVILHRKLDARRAPSAERGKLPSAPPKPKRYPKPSKEDRAAALAAALSPPRRASSAPPPPRAPSQPPEQGASAPPPPAMRPKAPQLPSLAASAPPKPSSPPLQQATVPRSPPPKPRHPTTPPQGTPRVLSSIPPARPSSIPPADVPPEEGWDAAATASPTMGVTPSKRARLELVPEPDSQDRIEASPDLRFGTAELSSDDSEAISFEEDEHGVPLAEASRSISVSARPPRPRYSSEEMRLPSVIVDVNGDCEELADRLVAGDAEAGDRLAEMGEHAVSALVARFPGPITAELRRGASDGPPRAAECGPVLRTLARLGSRSVPFIVVRTADSDPAVRAWATRLLGEIPTVDGARAIVKRFTDSDPEVRRAALAAGRLIQSDLDARTTLRDGLAELAAAPAQPKEVRLSAIEAMADIRDPRSMPRLVRLLEDRNSDVVKSADWALSVVTRQDFGRDTTRWGEWWQHNASRHRIEWLIDSLMHDNAEVRRAAGDELKALTKEYFGYYDDLPRKERAKAQQRYRDWWTTKGKARFP